VVCLRSYVGLALNFPWKGAGFWGTALIFAVVSGKTIGGFAADRFGLAKTSLFSLGIAALLFLFPALPQAGIGAVLLFNMTMPITLWVMAKILPGAKGFAFGLLTFGLFLGFLPIYLGIEVPPGASWLFALLAASSLALLWVGLRKAKM
jgi:FSR family fosmidomycin resistance protein-like MFS transporter